MAITKPPVRKTDDAAIQAFINGAPDAKAAAPEAKAPAEKSGKVMISLQMPADLLAKVDEAAAGLSLTRSGFIKQALARAVVSGGL